MRCLKHLARARSFRLLNLRQPARFVYFANGTEAPTALAASAPLAFANPNEPTGLRLALTGQPGQLRVSWTSWNASAVAPQLVRFAFDAAALAGGSGYVVPASSSTYSRTDMCNNPDGTTSVATGKGFLAPGTQHSAVMSTLPAAQRVWYSVGSNFTGWSPVRVAVTPPARGAPVSLLVISDMGQAEADGSNVVSGNGNALPFLSNPLYGNLSYYRMRSSLATAAALAAELRTSGTGAPAGQAPPPSVVFNNGDLSYANGYAPLWDVYADVIQAAASAAPWMIAVGNHESDWAGNPHSGRFNSTASRDSGGECGVPTAARYPMPLPAGASPDTPWYSFEAGALHVTVMSTEHPFDPDSPQYAWLAADLAAAAAARDGASVDASAVPPTASAPRWLLFAGHRPFFLSVSTSAGDLAIAFEMERVLGPLWSTYGVDVTLAGHHHSYQRTWALSLGVNQSACDDGQSTGTVHVVTGHGGAFWSPFGSGDPEEGLVAYKQNSAHGYVRITADALSLTLSGVASANGSVFDSVTLRKNPDPAVGRCAPKFDTPSFDFPTLERSTLGVACFLFLLVVAAYVLRSFGQWSEDRSYSSHNRAGLAALLEERHLEEQEEAQKRRLSLESASQSNPPSRSVSRRTSVNEDGIELIARDQPAALRLNMLDGGGIPEEEARLHTPPPPLPPRLPQLPPPSPSHGAGHGAGH